MRDTALVIGFHTCAAWLLYATIAFPVLTWLRSLLRPRPWRRHNHGTWPSLSVVIPAHNEATVIGAKLDNVLAADYPREQREILVASDGSTDDTNRIVERYAARGVRLLPLPRGGKNLTLNRAAEAATHEIIVISDADALLAPGALQAIAEPFTDPDVGGVAGNFVYREGTAEGFGERRYWSLDRCMKTWQSRAGSVTSATGQLFALRRELYRPMPRGVTDDFYASTQVVAQGKRLVFAPDAVAFGGHAETLRDEFRRKVRVACAGLRGLLRMRRLMNPLNYGLYSVQLISHKLLRRLVVLPVIGLGLCSVALWSHAPLYRVLAVLQGAFHLTAAGGALACRAGCRMPKLLLAPYYVDVVMAAVLTALAQLARGAHHDTWRTVRDHSAGTPEDPADGIEPEHLEQ